MNRDVCEHFNPVDLPCAKCEKPTLREAAQAVLDRWDSPKWEWHQGPTAALMADLRAALAEPVLEPVAWMHVPHPDNGLRPVVSLSQQRESSLYGASVPLFIKEQL